MGDATAPPMRRLVMNLRESCRDWLEIDELPSPPATAEMLRRTDRHLAKAMRLLQKHYPSPTKDPSDG